MVDRGRDVDCGRGVDTDGTVSGVLGWWTMDVARRGGYMTVWSYDHVPRMAWSLVLMYWMSTLY